MVNLETYNKIVENIPQTVTLVAVSKTHPAEDVQTLYNEGQRIFGENKVQELTAKYEVLPKDIEWHLIGHLQSNKVKYVAPFVSLIHSIDSLSLLQEVNKQAQKSGRVINCLLQFHIAEEDTKFGLVMDEAIELLQSEAYIQMQHINIVGVMGMGTFIDDVDQTHREFKALKAIFTQLKEQFFSEKQDFKEISMGMTDDFSIAIAEGSTMVRIGSAIFGHRNYL